MVLGSGKGQPAIGLMEHTSETATVGVRAAQGQWDRPGGASATFVVPR